MTPSCKWPILTRGIKKAKPASKLTKRRRSSASDPRKPREHSPISVSVQRVIRIWKEITKDVSLTKQPTFRVTTTGFPAKWCLRNERRDSILMTSHYPDLGSTSDRCYRQGNLLQPIRSTAQIWVVTRHQYGISALVPQMSFRGKITVGAAKWQLFPQATKMSSFQKISAHQHHAKCLLSW